MNDMRMMISKIDVIGIITANRAICNNNILYMRDRNSFPALGEISPAPRLLWDD